MELVATLFSGLGLFFIGFRMISRSLRQLTGPRLRQMVQHVTRTRFGSGFAGLVSGILSQSAAASVFIVIGFRSARFISQRNALTVIDWANVGSSVLVIIVALNFKLLILYFIGILGLLYFIQADKSIRMQVFFHFLLGLSLLFLGVQFIKNGAGMMHSVTWFREVIRLSSGSAILLFLAGVVLTMLAQSGPTVSVVALTLASAGLLGILQTLVIVLGTGIGSAVNIFILTFRMSGTARQLSIYQVIFKVTGVVLIAVSMFAGFLFTGSPEEYLRMWPGDDPGKQVAFIFLAMQLLPAFLLIPFGRPVMDLLARLSPPSEQEQLKQPRYLNDSSLADPPSALFLVGKEQERVLEMMPAYLLPVSPDRSTLPKPDISGLHEGFQALEHHIDQHIAALLASPGSAGLYNDILGARQYQMLLHDLESSLLEFSGTIQNSSEPVADDQMVIMLVESLRMIVDTAIDTFRKPETTDMDLLLNLTGDRSEVVDRIKDNILRRDPGTATETRQALFTLTLLFNRTCWILRNMTLNRRTGSLQVASTQTGGHMNKIKV